MKILGSKFWALRGYIKNLRTTFCRVPHGELTAKNGSIPSRNKEESIRRGVTDKHTEGQTNTQRDKPVGD